VRKPLPFTRSLAEFSRNRSQKDVTTASIDQMAPATGATGTVLPTNSHQTPTHNIKGKIIEREKENQIEKC
jgi:hypothetical protein